MDRERDALSPPEEFPAPAPEIAQPPEEFPPVGEPAAEDGAARRRRRKKLLYGAAAAALVLLLAPGRLARTPAARPAETAAPVPGAEATAETAAPEPDAAPEPESTAEATPAPTPEPRPDCEILFYNFSSASFLRLTFTEPEAFRSVELQLREPILDLEMERFSFGPEEIVAGVLELPGVETNELYFAHIEEYEALGAFPEELALHAVLVYDQDGETVTEERELMASPELGWGVRYWPRDAEESEWSFPGQFRFGTYESLTPVTLVLNDPDAVKEGVLSVCFTIDGREIDPDTIRYETKREAYTIGDMPISEPFYYARFYFPKPDWAPESGTLHVTVTQYFVNYRQVVVLERDYPFSEDAEEDW